MPEEKVHITSTPIKKRISIISSALRKSILPLQVMNNDDLERTIHRIETEERDKLDQSMTVSALDSTSANVSKGETAVNLESHFNICLKMFTTNKINSRNAWQLNILDYMNKVVNSKEEVRNILQVAGTSIEIGTKIYSVRVDDVYDEVLKLANALTQVHIKDSEDKEHDSDNEVKDKQVGNRKTKFKSKKRLECTAEDRSTISIQEEALNGPLKKNKIMTDYEDSNATSQLLNVTSIKKPGFNFQLMNKTECKQSLWKDTHSAPVSQDYCSVDMEDFSAIPSDLPICSVFKYFAIDIVNENEDVHQRNLNEPKKLNEHGFPEVYIDPNISFAEDNVDALENDINPEAVFVTEMRPLSNETFEYSYRPSPTLLSDFDLKGIWAGPSYWKLKCLRKSEPKFVPNLEIVPEKKPAKPKKKKESKYTKCNFDNMSLSDMKADLEALKEDKKKTVRSVRSNNFDTCTLPECQGIRGFPGYHLMNRPKVSTSKKEDMSVEDGVDIENYEYDNELDKEYCSAIMENDWENNSDDDGNMDVVEASYEEHVNKCEQNPEQKPVFKVVYPSIPNIPYAHTAKRIDMAELKKAVLEIVDHKQDKDNRKTKTKPEATLQDICRTLPTTLSPVMAGNLTPALAFAALLHVAADHKLNLKSAGLSNVIITPYNSE